VETLEHGLANARDLGGLEVEGGGRIRSGVLFRSDAPLAGEPDPDLAPWPPSCVIDLRSVDEQAASHPLGLRGAVVHSVPLMSRADPAKLVATVDGFTLLALYAAMVEKAGDLIVSVVDIIASQTGPTLVHCAVGKDRTGVIIAIVLSAVGVSRLQIVADYDSTGPNMAAVLERIVAVRPVGERDSVRAGIDQAPPHLLQIQTDAIEAVLDTVGSHDGGAAGWLLAHGLAPEKLAQLRSRLVDPAT
jgi:protein-tyrosine phosphatase